MSFPENMFVGASAGDSFTPTQIFSGSAAVFTDHATVAPATAIRFLQVVAKTAAGLLVPHAPAAGDSTAEAVGIAAMQTDGLTPGQEIGFYNAGCFNPAVVGWDATLDTLAERRAAFANVSTITIKPLK